MSITSRSERRLEVAAVTGSDFWRDTYYGFTRDSGHALLFDLPPGKALEVTITTSLDDQFDQAGLLVRHNAGHWVKAGVERTDGFVCAGAVVTDERSDWSSHPVSDWQRGAAFTLRVSYDREALVVRMRLVDGQWRLLRVCPFAGDGPVTAGPYLAAPGRAGYSAVFEDLRLTEADASLH
jgi:regulation of enolase protein 1 (concanavalin A-like superfamily)